MLKFLLFPYFLFSAFILRFLIIYFDFTRIAASKTASDDVKNLVTHRVFETNL